MFVRTATRKNKNGTTVRYLQLAHNEWDPIAKAAKMKVLHNFGREDQIDRAAVERLVGSLCRLLDPGRAAALTSGAELTFIGSTAYGGVYLLDQLWRQLKIDTILTRILASTRRSVFTERVLFALVANRALDASSKLAASHWVGRNAHIDGLPACSDDACYRAMDWLHQVQDSVERKVFDQVATLLNLEVDLLFFDTTSTYFEIDEPDEPIARDGRGVPLPDLDPENGDGDGDGDG
ncbi:transposase, partial [Nonomuraea diastatica]